MSDNQQQFLSVLAHSFHHNQCGAATNVSEVQHANFLSEHIGSLYMNENYSDITLIVDQTNFPAHKVILASRSEYFRALLFGGMRESSQREIELKDTNVSAFKILLRYIYTGQMSLASLRDDHVLEVLGLTHKYGFVELESAIIDYLKTLLDTRNLCQILGSAQLYSLDELAEFCLQFADRNAQSVLTAETFVQLPAASLIQLISRDSFCADEIDIFSALQKWAQQNNANQSNAEEWETIVSHVRLPLMRLDDLLNTVRPSGLISADVLLDAIKEQNEKRGIELPYRGFSLPNVNVATLQFNAQVIEGELKQALLNGDCLNYDMERGFTRHPIEDRSEGIVLQLGAQYIINHIRLLLWDRDQRSYSYYIEVSVDKHDWVKVVDYSRYLCRSWQKLYFSPRVVKYIRIVGVHNTVNRVFHVVTLEAMFCTDRYKLHDQILVPALNVATSDASACVVEGVSRSRNALINGNVQHYDWDSGYTCHQIGSGSIVVQLAQPFLIGSLALLLWDCDDRSYSYYIETSTDQRNWSIIVDKTKEACKSWQYLTFEPTVASFFRITGTRNTANEVFHCVHFECPSDNPNRNVIL